MKALEERSDARQALAFRRAWILLALGVVIASLSAILSRYGFPEGLSPRDISAWRRPGAVHPLALSFWRCALGAVALAPFGLARVRRVPRREAVTSMVAGAFLALHFGTWITSLGLTTIAAAVLLVSTTPVFVAIAARVLFDERLPSVAWAGIAAAFVGTAIVAGGGGFGEGNLSGNLLALAGGASAAGYALGGQAARRTLGILEYSVVAYGAAAVALLGVCVAAGVPLSGYGARGWAVVVAVTLGPQILGHTFINFALKDIGATTVTVAIMAEPVIATALAFVLLDEVPSYLVYPGGALILAGIYLASAAKRTPPVVVE